MESSLSSCCAPKSPRQAARRKQVADAARLLFAEQGFQNTRMEQISAAAGVKVGQIYRDFDGKEAIIADIVRADLARLLDEATLDRAVTDRNTCAVRTWIADFLQQEDEATKGRLVAQIIVEATRNHKIATLFEHADRWIRDCVGRALAVVAPAAGEPARTRLVEIIMVLIMGLSQRRVAAPDGDQASLASCVSALVERELDVLRAGKAE